MPEATASPVTPIDPGAGEPAAVAAPAVAVPVAAATPIPWLSGADDLTVGYVQNKGWTEPAQVLDGYRNLEKVMGADRLGRTVVMPKPDAPPAEMEAYFNKLGRPSDPSGYKFELPSDADPKFASGAAAEFHRLGVPKDMAEGIVKWNNDQVAAAQEAAKQEHLQKFQADDAALHTKWGLAFSQEMERARAAARGLGVTEEQVNAMELNLGHMATMEFFRNIGLKIGEPDFVSGDGKASFGGAMTSQQALAKIAALRQDKDFVARYQKKDAAAVAEMGSLHKFAYPEARA